MFLSGTDILSEIECVCIHEIQSEKTIEICMLYL